MIALRGGNSPISPRKKPNDHPVCIVIAANPAKVAEFKAGNDKVLNWMTGQVMKGSGGKANPKLVTELLRTKIGS